MMRTIGKTRGMFVGLIAILFLVASDTFGDELLRNSMQQATPASRAVAYTKAPDTENWVTRTGSIAIDVQMLHAAANQLQAGEKPTISLQLFDDLPVTVEVYDSYVTDRGTLILNGVISRSMASSVTLSVLESRVAGYIIMPPVGEFVIRPIVGGAMHEVGQLDHNAMPTCGVGPEHSPPAPFRPVDGWDNGNDEPMHNQHAVPGDILCNDEAVATLLVFVTPAVIEYLEDIQGPSIVELVETDVAFLNKALQHSRANVSFKLVGIYLVDHDEEGSPPDDLAELRFGAIEVSIGGNPTVHQLRSLYCTDFVAMIVSYEDDPVCGVAYIMPTPSADHFDTAFSVTRVQCMPGRTFAHELGHNMGGAHDHWAGGVGTYAYSHGHRYLAPSPQLTPDDDTWYATIMAYPPYHVAVPLFSNPEVEFPDGYPTGVPINQPMPAHNVLTFNNNAPFFSQYGQMVGFGDCKDTGAFEVPQDYPTIQAAIDAVPNGARIVVYPGVYNEQINFKGKSIEMLSIDPCNVNVVESTIIDGGQSGTAVTFSTGEGSNTILNGFTIRNGFASQGGGIRIQNSSPKLRNLIIRNNHATLAGGGIHVVNGSPDIDRLFISNNTASFRAAGMYIRGGFAGIQRVILHNNNANILAGGVFLETTGATINKSKFLGNSAGSHGGAVYVLGGSPNINETRIEDNHVTASDSTGGGFFVRDSTLTITNSDIIGNSAGMSGGGVFVYVDEEEDEDDWILPDIGSTEICDNTPNNIFGPWNNLGNNEVCSALADHVVCENPADPGDCAGCMFSSIQTAIEFANSGDSILVCQGEYFELIDFDGKEISVRSENPLDPAVVEATIINGQGNGTVLKFTNGEGLTTQVRGFTITGGHATNGGGARIVNSAPRIENCVFDGNTANSNGGGVYVSGSAGILTGSTFRNNTAVQNSGGGIYIQASDGFTLENCHFENNHAGAHGGGIGVFNSDNMMSEIVLDGNSATNQGGGIRLALGAESLIQNFTVKNNTAASGGGLSSSANSMAFVTGSLFCQNSPDDIEGPWINFGGNTFDDVCPISNNTLFSPTPLSGTSGSIVGSFAGASVFGTSSCDPGTIDVYYSYEVTDGPVTFMLDTCGSGSDTALAVFDPFYNEIGCSTTCGGTPCGGPDACLYLAGIENGIYIIRVSLASSAGANSGPGHFVLNYSSVEYVSADLNGDGAVDGADLLILLSSWGNCAEPANCPTDLNGDGTVDGADLLILLSNWG